MINPIEKGVRGKNFSCEKGVCDQCVVFRYCEAPPYFKSKINHRHLSIHIQSEIKQKERKLYRTKIYHGRDKLNLTYEMDLCDNRNILSNKYKLIKTGKLLGLNPKLAMRYAIKVGIWRIGKRREEKI